ncbi:MAG: tetratricopeptide repeat protein, partial [Myxococcota bacterium]
LRMGPAGDQGQLQVHRGERHVELLETRDPLAPPLGCERVPRFKQLDMALTPVNLQLALIARGPHSETTALFGPVATVEDSPQVGRLVDEGLANPHWTLIWRAEHNLALRNYERAEQYFRQALDATPESGRATLGLAEINFWNADYAAAVVAYERAIELGEQPGVGYKGIGWSEYNRGAYVEATRAFGAALAILREEGDPRSPHVRDALRGTAYALAARGECTRAVAALVSASIHAMPEPVSRHCPKDAERGE